MKFQSYPESNATLDGSLERLVPNKLNPAVVQSTDSSNITTINSNQDEQMEKLVSQPAILKTDVSIKKVYYQKKVVVLTYHHLDPIESSSRLHQRDLNPI